jgi:hypothetical protein
LLESGCAVLPDHQEGGEEDRLEQYDERERRPRARPRKTIYTAKTSTCR